MRKDSARAVLYAVPMADEDELAPEPNTVAKNIATLMRLREWNQSELDRRSKVSQRHISDILRGQSDCTTEVIEKLADAFDIEPWQLMVPNLSDDLLAGQQLKRLISAYAEIPAGRALIDGAVDMVLKNNVPFLADLEPEASRRNGGRSRTKAY